MRSTLLLSLISVLSLAISGYSGCAHGLPLSDMGEADMAVPLDMSGIPDDFKKLVTFSMFAQDYAEALCSHYMACGQLDAAQMPACIERNLRHTGWDQDVEIMKGRMEIN